MLLDRKNCLFLRWARPSKRQNYKLRIEFVFEGLDADLIEKKRRLQYR